MVIYVTVRNLSLEKPCLQPEVCFVCAVAVESPPPPGGEESWSTSSQSREFTRRGVQEENLQVQSKPSSLNFRNDASSQS